MRNLSVARLGGSGSVSLMKLQSSCCTGLQLSGGSTGPRGSASLLTYPSGCWPASVSCWLLTGWHLHFHATYLSVGSSTTIDQREKRATKTESAVSFIIWFQKWHAIISSVFIWSHRLTLLPRRKGYSGCRHREAGCLSCKLATTVIENLWGLGYTHDLLRN